MSEQRRKVLKSMNEPMKKKPDKMKKSHEEQRKSERIIDLIGQSSV